MVVEALLPLLGAPYLNAVLGEPLHHERRLVVNPPDPVEHEYQEDVKLVVQGSLFQFLDGVPVVCRYLITGNPFFGKLFQDYPILLITGKLTTRLFLHGDVILILIILVYLLFTRYSIKTINPFHYATSVHNLVRDCATISIFACQCAAGAILLPVLLLYREMPLTATHLLRKSTATLLFS